MNPDILNSLIAQWAREDARMPPGYVAPPSVLCERLLSVRFDTLKNALYNVRTDVWFERDGERFIVGAKDNRNSAEYNMALSRLAARAAAVGWKARLYEPRAAGTPCTLAVRPPDLSEAAHDVHPLYLRTLKTERAVLAQRGA